ncbi:pyridoxal-phosphate dependent enzyme [Kribbella sp. NPDC049174]|uniref:pyridoxal-phosphate dependent enzyme n=1 Tax=Kribbella sp. NPDC049174 TaxID=3364112 RepID=UPI003718D742
MRGEHQARNGEPGPQLQGRGTELVANVLAGNASRAVVCASAGNLGQALAWSGRGRGLDVTVVASRFATTAKLDRIRAQRLRLASGREYEWRAQAEQHSMG